MDLLIPSLLLIVGLAGLSYGADFLIRGAVSASRLIGISPFIIGLTVVAWGTSAPEVVVTVGAALGGVPDVAVGNVIGSNITNRHARAPRIVSAALNTGKNRTTLNQPSDG